MTTRQNIIQRANAAAGLCRYCRNPISPQSKDCCQKCVDERRRTHGTKKAQTVTIRGKIYRNLRHAMAELDCPHKYQTVWNRIAQGWTPAEAILIKSYKQMRADVSAEEERYK